MLYLNRYISDKKITRGILIYKDVPLCHTLELPNLDNQKYKSCIPTGVYDAHKMISALHGLCFRLAYVPGRSGILIHAGNSVKDTGGCILPGLDCHAAGLIYSRKAMDRLLVNLPPAFTITIRDLS